MIDREKVIEGLERCTQHGSMCGCDCNGHYEYSEPDHERIVLVENYRESCPYGKCETGCVKTLARDALALLKAQEQRHRLEVHNIGNVDVPEGVTWEQFQAVMSGVVKALEHTDRGESWPYDEEGR